MVKRMKNHEIVGCINGLNAFIGKDKVLPVRVSYAINKNMKSLIDAYQPYEDERKKIMGDSADFTDVSPEDKEKMNNAMQELLDIDVDVEIHTIALSVLDSCDNLSSADMIAMDFMIEE